MFKFDFNIENTIDEPVDAKRRDTNHEDGSFDKTKGPSLTTSTVGELIKYLPQLISYSPLRISASGNQCLTLLRRDLFDARFQLISESCTTETSQELDFIDAPSDLVPGVYEGGLKTWECSADLAAYLHGAEVAIDAGIHSILEVGCGTAIPSLYLLRSIFYADHAEFSTETPWTNIHMQDYNSVVLQLVTLPNIVLTWYASPASESYRLSQTPPLPEASISQPGELSLPPKLLSAFVESLRERHIDLKFVSGSWTDTEAWICDRQSAYDLILTSETIYRPSSLPSLISLLHTASTLRSTTQKNEPPSSQLAHLSLNPLSQAKPTLCFVAAKVIYFGVGGGVDSFEKAVGEAGGITQRVAENKTGVTRRIIQVTWTQAGSG